MIFVVDLEAGVAAVVGEALDRWLPANGVKGCMVMAGNGQVSIIWAKNLGLSVDKVRRAVEAVKAMAMHVWWPASRCVGTVPAVGSWRTREPVLM